ncbi:hypothetical protein [Streptomyces sp. NPDC055709]
MRADVRALISHDATWARQPAKELTRRELFSKPLIDGRPERRSVADDECLGRGATLESRAYEGQGGGFLSLDGHLNYEVAGTEADFRIVLAVGKGTPPTAAVDGSALSLGSTTYDLDSLGDHRPAGTRESSPPARDVQ